MRHLLEAVLRVEDAELDIPFIHGAPGSIGDGDQELRLTRNAYNALRDIASMEMENLLRERQDIANINPLQQLSTIPFYDTLTQAIAAAQTSREFGADTPANVDMGWYCTGEPRNRVQGRDVQTGTPTLEGQEVSEIGTGYVGYCTHHGRYEVVELQEVTEGDEVEEDRIWIGAPNTRFRITRVPTWVDQHYLDQVGEHLAVGDEGRILWDDRITNTETRIREAGWFVQMDAGYEIALPRDIMGAPRR